MIGIMGAMAPETELLEKNITNKVKKTFANRSYIYGDLFGKEVCLTTCGIGKVNAALCAQIMIDQFAVDTLINTGVAGGIREEIVPGDIVIATDLIEHDMDTTHFGDPLGQIPDMNVLAFPCDSSLRSLAKNIASSMNLCVHEGRIVSGDQFIADHGKADFLYDTFAASACEMEGAAIAHVCYVNQVKSLVIRAISDNARSGATCEYQSFVASSSQISAQLVMSLIRNL